MKKFLLAICALLLLVNISAQGISIDVNVNLVLEGTIISKKGGKLSNTPVSIYGWDKLWIITTNDKGYYRANLTEGGSAALPPPGMDGQGNIIFYYTNKRYFVFPAKDLQIEEGDVDGLPIAHLDVKL